MTSSQTKHQQTPDNQQEGQVFQDRNILALDALSKLARQFSNKPDLNGLIEVLLLTLCGQFSVTSAFSILQNPRSSKEGQLYFGFGKFRQSDLLSCLLLTPEFEKHLLETAGPMLIEGINLPGSLSNYGYIMQECGVHVIVPLIHDRKVIGLLGMGNRVAGKACAPDDCELLTTIVNTVTPFIVNSFLFIEISKLNSWHLSILDSVKQGVFVFDTTERLKKVNSSGFQILSQLKANIQSPESLQDVPMGLIFSDKIFPGWLGRISSSCDGISGCTLENMVAKHGEIERIYNISVSRGHKGQALGNDIIITLDDITEQKQSEQQLFNLEKYAEKGLMASSIAHELNNFLGLVLGGVELTELALQKNNMDKIAGILERLKETVAKMGRFTSGLMDYNRLNTTKAPANLNTIISDVLSFISVQKKFSNISIITDLERGMARLELDGQQIAQLLLNLLNNAADAIHEASPTTGQISVKTLTEAGKVSISISDNGVGIPDELKERLFKNHFTTKENGHGYGLVTVGNIIANHNADVKIDSQVGRGTTFTFHFPLSSSSEISESAR